MKLIFIGDVHGKMDQLRLVLDEVLRRGVQVFQVGDMALGFPGVILPSYPANFHFTRGNYDSPDACRSHPNYLGDYGYLPKLKLFYMGGAFSIDAPLRRARMRQGGLTEWWPDEELSLDQVRKALEMYSAKKPEIVVSHDCPSSIGALLVQETGNTFGPWLPSRTAQALQWMFELHQPKHWVFGHYHIDKTISLDGTVFHCCAELSTYEVEI